MEKRKPREKTVIFSRRFSIDQYDTRHGTDQSMHIINQHSQQYQFCQLSTQTTEESRATRVFLALCPVMLVLQLL
jgi:hypothetical protein